MAAKYLLTPELMAEVRRFITHALPTHMARGGDADRQELLKKLASVEIMQSFPEANKNQ